MLPKLLTQDKGLDGIKISVLGTDYLIRCVKASDMPSWFFERNKGYCDHTVKVITVEDLITRKDDYKDALGDLEMITNQTVRHELIHAFLRESGLGDEAEIDEVIIDWLALQAPKIMKAFCQVNAFTQEEMSDIIAAFTAENVKEEEKSNVAKRITDGN